MVKRSWGTAIQTLTELDKEHVHSTSTHGSMCGLHSVRDSWQNPTTGDRKSDKRLAMNFSVTQQKRNQEDYILLGEIKQCDICYNQSIQMRITHAKELWDSKKPHHSTYHGMSKERGELMTCPWIEQMLQSQVNGFWTSLPNGPCIRNRYAMSSTLNVSMCLKPVFYLCVVGGNVGSFF